MERSPRSAAVQRTGASMGQYHTLRSFVIPLVIAITITNSPASSFTIRQSQNPLDSTPDLETGESTHLEVRYDLKGANNNNRTVENVTTFKGDLGDSSVIAINDPKNLDVKNESNEKVSVTQTVNETADIGPKISEERYLEITSDTTKLISPESSSYSYTTAAPSTSQTTTREPDKNPDFSTKSTSQTSLLIESQIDGFKNETVTPEVKENEIKSSEARYVTEPNTTPEIKNYKGETESFTGKPNTVDVSYSYVNSDKYKSEKRNDSVAAESNVANKEVFNTNNKVENNVKSNQINTKEEMSINKTKGSLDIPTTTPAPVTKTEVANDTIESPTTVTTTEILTTETLSTNDNPSTLPAWKKYITIDRKRTSIEDTTVNDMAQEETAQTRISLEKVFSNTPIPSLEKLRNDLINAQESTTRILESTHRVELNMSSPAEATTPMIAVNEADNATTKLELVSKRAGYKDNRETTTPKAIEATTAQFSNKVSANDSEVFNSMYETEASEAEVADIKNVTVYESQSQLAEDAIKEELLKEETLNDNEENAKRHHDEQVLPQLKRLKPVNMTDEPVILQEAVTEDMLSVKPIGNEKKKNTILYAVSPNYKPLKKIDVQPPKQFIRDPDDNSWRNESISSLGIVFKPKNASKSFTEVLKNKTEIELANMTDKENKGDVPDLRVRLEKIAEVRKSKKRINKFGDTVYSDYEESGENPNPSKEETTSPMTPLVESVLSFTPPSSPKSTTEFDLTVNAISKDHFDLFKNDLTTPLTTLKPKKFYNLAEYYDATDEYDADYVNAHKIDLKKFTQPLKAKESHATQLPDLLRTKPMTEYQPERKATLQYFPPTQKVTQKVNLNDYDTDFHRKVALYTFKDSPKHVLHPSYGTLPPSQTEQYEQVNKVTMKPNYTPVYKTDNLDKNLYLTNQPRVSEPPSGFVPNDGNFNRASYVIKHYRDFINEAAKEGEDERSVEYTEAPLRGVTINELVKMTTHSNQGEEEYDYDVKFRKDIMNRFVDNFNQNSERFKVDFPILYNNSVVHRPAPENGKPASSSAFLKRLYEAGHQRPANYLSNRRPCEPHCENMTVDLSPAYELHYYVPEQEEKEEMEPRPITLPYRYRL